MKERRHFLYQVSLLSGAVVLWRSGNALATDDRITSLIRAYAGNAPLRQARVAIEIAPLVDNGNSVPITVDVSSPMSASDRVTEIAIFNEKNPQPEVAEFTLGPRAGRAKVTTRIRLATTQKIVAVAKMSDGSCWFQTVEVVVALAACLED